MPVPQHPWRSIVIVGGGFAGAATAIKLIKATTTPLRITIVERRPELGRGVAYDTAEPDHLVNAPAEVFSLYPAEEPNHFADWLDRHIRDEGLDPAPWSEGNERYAPRRIYGRYVRDELARVAAGAGARVTLEHVASTATDLAVEDGGVRVETADGRAVVADHAVLALGIFQSRPAFVRDPGRLGGRYVQNPWDLDAYRQFRGDGTVVVIGAGLTMVDAVISLENAGFTGRSLAVSRRGLTPEARRGVPAWPDFLGDKPLPRTAVELLRAVREERRRVLAAGADPQSLVLAIRPHLAALWAGADDTERRRYLRHLRIYWEISLHRAAVPSARILDRIREEGRFGLRAGRFVDFAPAADGRIAVTVRWRDGGQEETILADGVVNATGADFDWRRHTDVPLVRTLLDRGLVQPGSLSFGIRADGQGAVIGRDGRASGRISALGPPVRGAFWESNSIPELLVQVDGIVKRLAAAGQPADLEAVA